MQGMKREQAPKHSDQDKRVNPWVLRQILFEMVRDEFENDGYKAASRLQLSRPSKGKMFPFTKHSIDNIIADRTALKYVHLEAMAEYYDIPTGLLLLFSRLRAEERDSPNDKPLHDVIVVQQLLQFLTDIATTLKGCTFETSDLKKWQEEFNASNFLSQLLSKD